ncbi:hypothetical protein H072_10098 [Dactylellina haptotyla CBS 200.50]|uniref:Uncharacterized protein n=1 Tax=Dactylellina haptotyla (strain CBS 200.50) TaxID=1284197 RepID=S8BB88_DACHA|nr:hypothetical protein H072_10098 [Dactylellina haptotyla CBS 200.50]
MEETKPRGAAGCLKAFSYTWCCFCKRKGHPKSDEAEETPTPELELVLAEPVPQGQLDLALPSLSYSAFQLDDPLQKIFENALDELEKSLRPDLFERIKDFQNIESLYTFTVLYQKRYAESQPSLYKKLQSCVAHLNSFNEVWAAFSQTNGTIGGPVWGCLRLCLEVTVRSHAVFERILEMIEELCYDLDRIKRIVSTFDKTPEISEAVARVYIEFLGFCAEIIKYSERHFLKNAVAALVPGLEESFSRRIKKIELQLNRVEKEASLAHWARSSSKTVLSSPEKLRLIPYQRNTRFFPRDTYIDTVSNYLDTVHHPNEQRCFAFCGMPGVGKTELAIKYCHESEYKIVLWFRAETDETLAQGFSDAALALHLITEDAKDQKKIRLKVFDYLRNSNDWLVVFDNVDKFLTLEQFFPHAQQGSILVTTRDAHAAGTFAGMCKEVAIFEPSEAGQFLLSLIEDPKSPKSLAPEDIKDAEHIAAVQMGGLPLGIELMAGSLKGSEKDIGDFRKLYENEARNFRNRFHEEPASIGPTFYEKLLIDTWKWESFSPEASKLLDIFAFLAPNDIPESLFKTRSIDSTMSTESEKGTLSLVLEPFVHLSALRELKSRSMIKKVPGGYNIHRLIQEAKLHNMSDSERQIAFDAATSLLLRAFPLVDTSGKQHILFWPVSQQLIHHVQFAEKQSKRKPKPLRSVAFATLLNRAAYYLFERHFARSSEYLYDAVGEICDTSEPSKEVTYLKAEYYHMHAWLYKKLGKESKAKSAEGAFRLEEKALELRLQLEPESIKVAGNYGQLAMFAIELQKWDESLAYSKKCLDLRWNKYRYIAVPNISVTFQNYGWCLLHMKRYEEAKKHFEDAIWVMEDHFKEDAPSVPQTNWAIYALGNYYLEVGDEAKAMELHLRALGNKLEFKHDAVSSQYKVAWLYRKRGDNASAMELLQNIIKESKDEGKKAESLEARQAAKDEALSIKAEGVPSDVTFDKEEDYNHLIFFSDL